MVDLDALAAALRKVGVPADKTGFYAAMIGDTPEFADDSLSQLVVRDTDGRVLALVPSSVFW